MRFRTRDPFKAACQKMIEMMQRAQGTAKRNWVLVIDSTSTKRGGFTKIGNAIEYKRKGKNRKGKSSKAHSFVMGLWWQKSATLLVQIKVTISQ